VSERKRHTHTHIHKHTHTQMERYSVLISVRALVSFPPILFVCVNS